MAVSRLFVEIGKDVDRLNASLRQSMEAAKEAGIQVTASGQRMLAAFDRALRPTVDLGEQIRLLQSAGKSSSDIWKVYENQINAAVAAQKRMGTAIDPTVDALVKQNAAAKASLFSFKGITDSLGTVQKTMLGLGLAVGASQIIRGMYNIGKASLSMAMDAVESENLFAVSMGKMSEDAHKWSQDLSKTLGLNQYELRKNIATFNTMFMSMELGQKAAYDMSAGLTKLSYDMASFYNLKPEEAFDKLRAGITGETEPLKRLGILVDEANTKTYAYTHGIAKQGEELTQQEKVLARYGSILRQTEAAQGDLARTMDSPANQFRVLRSRAEELQTTLGMALLPAMVSITGELTKMTSAGEVNTQGLQYLAKVISFPIMSFYTLGRAVAETRLKLAEFDLWLKNKNPLEFDYARKYAATVVRDAASDVLAYNEKIEKLEKSVEAIGKFDHAAAAAAAEKARADRDAADAATRRSLAQKQVIDTTEQQMMTDYEFVTMLARLKKQEWDEISSVKLDIPKVAGTELDIELKKESMPSFVDMTEQVEKASEKYRKAIEEMWQHASVFTQTVQEEQLAALDEYYQEIQTLRDLDLISEEEYSNARRRIAAEESAVKLSQAKMAFGTLASMQTSHIRAIAAIGKAAAIAQATINTYEGATKALAQGGVWGMIQMGAVLAAGFAQVASIASQGFKSGGYTGSVSRDSVAGVVHGQEYVMNANATAQYLPLLEMLNRGREVGSQMDSGPGMGVWGRPVMNVQIANYGSGKTFDVEHVDENTVRVIARDEAYNVLSRRGPEVIAADLAYPNSRTSKAIAKHTTARRGDR